MTNQEAFDHVCKHLAQQKRRSEVDNGGCRYKYGALSCAIGCLIPDNKYSFWAESCQVDALSDAFLDWVGLSDVDRGLLKLLQMAHDTSYAPGDLFHALTHVAEQFNLDDSNVFLIREWQGVSIDEDLLK